MGGLAPRVGTSDVAVYRHKIIKGGRGLPELNGKTPEQQQYYMKVNKLLSVNPAGLVELVKCQTHITSRVIV